MGFSLETIVWRIIVPGIGQTLQMLAFGFLFAVSLGFVLAIVLILTAPDGLKPHPVVYHVLDFVINVLRSMPFIILMITLMPLTRLIFGTVIGSRAAIFSMSVACAPLVARLLESSFREVDPGLIEAAKSFGAPTWRIVWNVVVGESVPSMVSQITLAAISILGCSAMAGVVGAGGLGAIALTYGYQNFNDAIMYSTVLILVVLVMIIQNIGNAIYRKIK
jgi:D-methionine transport system permease protein